MLSKEVIDFNLLNPKGESYLICRLHASHEGRRLDHNLVESDSQFLEVLLQVFPGEGCLPLTSSGEWWVLLDDPAWIFLVMQVRLLGMADDTVETVVL